MAVKLHSDLIDVGPIPVDWILRPLGDIGKWYSGGTPSMKNANYWFGETPWASPKDMKVPRLFDTADHITTKAISDGARVLPVGSVLIVIRGMILAHSFPVARAETPLAFNQDMKALIVSGEINSNFVLYWLIGHGQKLLGLTTESTHGTKRLPPETIYRVRITLPPTLAEQKAIAGALSDADAWIESLEQLITKKRQIKQGAMQELLTVKRRLPGFSGEWDTKRLGELAPLQRGFDLPTHTITEGPYPVVYSNGILNYHAKHQVKGPGVVTGRSGTIGKVTFVESDFWPHNTSLWVTSFKGNDPKYVFYLYSRIGFDRFATGSGVPTLNRNDVHAFRMAVPSLPEQSAIAAILSVMDTEIDSLESQLAKAREIKQGMMQELLTGRIRLV
jgi:type I restriction enzyme S subunit